MTVKHRPRLLSIAGSDSGGGAGIQADLKTFQALGGYGMTAITAITAQNTVAVSAVHPVPASVVTAQIDAVMTDIGVDAMKIGMAFSTEIITAIASSVAKYRPMNVVVDPVMVAKDGSKLLQNQAISALKSQLFPLASVITPNIPEAEVIAGRSIESVEDMRDAAIALTEFCPVVVLKGGHLGTTSGTPSPTVFDFVAWRDGTNTTARSPKSHLFTYERCATKNTHGTGCSFSAAIAAYLGRGLATIDAVSAAGQWLHEAIVSGAQMRIGKGHGPIDHGVRLGDL